MPKRKHSRDRNVPALALRQGKGAHRDRYREIKDREVMEADMSDVAKVQRIPKQDIIREVLNAYAEGADSAACMAALAPLVEWLLEEHEMLEDALLCAESTFEAYR